MWALIENSNDLLNLCNRRSIDISKIEEVQSANRYNEMLAERLLLEIICKSPTVLEHTIDGMPYISNSDLHISITHTYGAVCVAVNDKRPIGIDIERKGSRVLRVRDKFLNEMEKRFIPDNDEDMNVVAWTAKEALFKVIPETGIDFKDDLQLNPFAIEGEEMITFGGPHSRTTPIKNY